MADSKYEFQDGDRYVAGFDEDGHPAFGTPLEAEPVCKVKTPLQIATVMIRSAGLKFFRDGVKGGSSVKLTSAMGVPLYDSQVPSELRDQLLQLCTSHVTAAARKATRGGGSELVEGETITRYRFIQ